MKNGRQIEEGCAEVTVCVCEGMCVYRRLCGCVCLWVSGCGCDELEMCENEEKIKDDWDSNVKQRRGVKG